MPTAWLCQIDAARRSDGVAASIRVASHDDDRLCHLDPQTPQAPWWPAIAQLPKFAHDFFDGAFGGAIATPSGQFDLSIDAVPGYAALMLHGARIRWWSGELGAAFAAFTLRFDGLVGDQPTVRDGRASVAFKVDDRWLDDPLLSLYAGTTGAEGEAGLKGQVKPLMLGAPRMTEGVLINSIDTIVQLSDGPIAGVDVAMENVARFAAPVANYATYAALQAATIAPGFVATALSVGMIRHGAPPAGVLTYDVQGSNSGGDGGGQVRRVGAIVKRLAARMGKSAKVDTAALTAIDVARPYNVSVALTQQTTLRELAQSLAQSINAVALVTWTGLLTILPIPVPGSATAVETLATDGTSLPPVGNIAQLAIASPFWRVAIEAEVTNRVHSYDEIRFTAPLVPRGRYDPAEIYREGQIVELPDGSTWLYTATTPGSGNAPPTWPETANIWWFNLSPPLKASGITYDDGQTVEELQPAEPGATDGAVIPTPGSLTPSNIKDESGAIRPASDLLNTSMFLTDKGRLLIDRGGAVTEARGQVTSALEYLCGQTMEALRPAEGGATAGAVIPSAGFVGPVIGGIRDELGLARPVTDLLNTALALDPTGILSIARAGGVRQELGRIAVDALGAASAAAQRRADTAMERLAAIVTQIDTRLATTQGVIRDAGIYVDPSSGRVVISAIDATAERINNVSITLDAVQGSLALTASRSYVDSAIATAVLDPSQVPVFAGLAAQITAVEVRLDGAEANLLLKADAAFVTAIDASLTAALIDIDALEGAITTKVDSVVFGALETRVAGAETTLAALGDTASIGRDVSVARMVARKQDDEAAASLGAILAGDRSHREQLAAMASASDQLTTLLLEGDAAEAAARLSLAVQVGAVQAGLAEERIVRIAENAATVTSLETLTLGLGAEAGARAAEVTAERLARQEADGTLTTAISTKASTASVDALGTRLTSAEATLVTQDNALGLLAGRVDTLQVNMTTETSERNAAVAAEQLARAEADGTLSAAIALKASTASVDGLSTRVSSAETVIAALGDVAGMKRDISVSRRAIEASAANDLEGTLAADRAARAGQAALSSAGEELTTRLLEGDAAEAAARLSLAVQVGAVQAGLAEERIVRIAENAATVASLNTLTLGLATEAGARSAEVTAERLARQEADGTLATAISTKASTASVDALGTRLSSAETTLVTQDNALGLLAGRIDTLQVNLSNETSALNAAISAAQNTFVHDIGVVAEALDTVSTTVGDHSASIEVQALSLDGLLAKYGFELDVNGRVIGWTANNDGASGGMDFVIDYLRFWDAAGTTSKAPFEFRNGGLYVSQLSVDSLSVKDGAVGGIVVSSPPSLLRSANNVLVGIVEVPALPAGTNAVRVTLTGDFQIEALAAQHVWARLREVSAAQAAAFKANPAAVPGGFPAIPGSAAAARNSDKLEYAFNVWDNAHLSWIDTAPESGQLYIVTLDALSPVDVRWKDVQLSAEIMKRTQIS